MKVTVWCMLISRGKRKIAYIKVSSILFSKQSCCKQGKLKLDIQHVQLDKKSFYLFTIMFYIEVHCKFAIYISRLESK